MSDTLRDDILHSEAARRMVETVTPIYDNSYVGLWLYEAMGREWDAFWSIVSSLQTELSPETATWMLELWERRYGLTPSAGSTVDERRQAIAQMRELPHPLSPYRLERYLEAVTGRTVNVEEHTGEYTFGITITGGDEDKDLNMESLTRYIDRHKPSHMSYDLAFEARTRILLSVETAYWRYHYEMAGTKPYRNIVGGLSDGEIAVTPAPHGYVFEYPFAGTDEAGVIPQINITAGSEQRGIVASASGGGYNNSYIPCGVTSAGRGVL